jgi:hypothetical protein
LRAGMFVHPLKMCIQEQLANREMGRPTEAVSASPGVSLA